MEVSHLRLVKPFRSLCDLGAEVQNKHEGQTLSVRSFEKMFLNISSTFPLKLRHAIQFLCHGMGLTPDGYHRVTVEVWISAWSYSLALALALSVCSYSHRMPGLHPSDGQRHRRTVSGTRRAYSSSNVFLPDTVSL